MDIGQSTVDVGQSSGCWPVTGVGGSPHWMLVSPHDGG